MLSLIRKYTSHFNERLIERFDEVEFPLLEKTIQKAIQKAKVGETYRYTHPLYHITVVINKLGTNGAELITCWKGQEC